MSPHGDATMDEQIADLMVQVRRQQSVVEQAQRAVEQMEISGTSRDGEVTARLRGTGEFTEISIDPQSFRRYDAETMGSLVLEAVNDGLRKLGAASKAKFEPIIDEFQPGNESL